MDADKLSIVGCENSDELLVVPVKPSKDHFDIQVQVIYTTEDGVAASTSYHTVHKPNMAKWISNETKQLLRPGEIGYIATVKYILLDQFYERIPFGGLSVEEDLNPVFNPYHTNFEERDAITFDNAEYFDEYKLYMDRPVPNNYSCQSPTNRKSRRLPGSRPYSYLWSKRCISYEKGM